MIELLILAIILSPMIVSEVELNNKMKEPDTMSIYDDGKVKEKDLPLPEEVKGD